MRDDIGWRQDHADKETANHDIRSFPTQTLWRRESGKNHEHRRDWNLKDHPKREHQLDDEIQILIYVRHPSYVLGRRCREELEYQREHQEVGEQHSHIKKQDAREQQREGEFLLTKIESGCNETPDLMQDEGHRNEQRHISCQFEGRQEWRGYRGCDHLDVTRQVLDQRSCNELVYVIGEVKKAYENNHYRDDRPEEALPKSH